MGMGFPWSQLEVGGLSTSGSGGGDIALWLAPPPPKGSIDAPPQNPTQTDPLGPRGDPDPEFGTK